MKTKTLTRTAFMVCFICICSWVTIPGAIPHTLQVMGVFFALFILGKKAGTAAVFVYILLGAVGLPVYSSFGGGVGVLFGPTGGFILGFLVMCAAYAFGLRVGMSKLTAAYFSLMFLYGFGVIWFSYVSGITFFEALIISVVPFVIPDAIKIYFAYFLQKKLSMI